MREESTRSAALPPRRGWYTRTEWSAVWLCLAFNLALLGAVAIHRPAYLHDFRLSDNPDARDYVQLGRNVLLHGVYSRNVQPPYVPDMLRTPVYPLVAGALDLLGGPWLIFVGNAVAQAITCLLLFRLVQPRFGHRAAAVAAFLVALDPMLAISNLQPMSEPVYGVLVLASIVCAAPALWDVGHGRLVKSETRLAWAGALFAAATLTRPAGLYLALVVAATIAVRAWRAGQWPAVRASLVALLLTAFIPPALWTARNAIVFSVPHLSNADAIVLVYFTGAGGYQLHDGVGLEEAQARVSRDFNLPPAAVTYDHWLSDQTVAEMDTALRDASSDVLMTYPLHVVLGGLYGIVKSGLGHNVGLLMSAMGAPWTPPGGGAVLRGDLSGAVRRLFSNPLLAVVLLFWSLAITTVTLALVVRFAVIAAQNDEVRRFAFGLAPVLAYFYLTVAMFGPEAYFRSRAPHVPLLCATAGIAASIRVERRRNGIGVDRTGVRS